MKVHQGIKVVWGLQTHIPKIKGIPKDATSGTVVMRNFQPVCVEVMFDCGRKQLWVVAWEEGSWILSKLVSDDQPLKI